VVFNNESCIKRFTKILEDNNPIEYYSADSRPLGKSFAEWTVKWWQWVYSIPRPKNPITDTTGKLCEIGQTGEIWFLGGKPADKSSYLPVRNCAVPSGLPILFPVINCEANQIEFPLLDNTGLIENVTTHMKLIRSKVCYINGTQIPVQHVRSEPIIFDIEITYDNVFGLERAGKTRASADGYWVFLKPLRKGNYFVNFSGSCSSGIRRSGAEYHLEIV
jgi:hypothetical protein